MLSIMSVSSDEIQECWFCPQESGIKKSANADLDLCPHCREVFYCSEAHFRLHRSYDGSKCLPFRVVETEERGRILVATRQDVLRDTTFNRLIASIMANIFHCLALPLPFLQPRDHLSAKPCTYNDNLGTMCYYRDWLQVIR